MIQSRLLTEEAAARGVSVDELVASTTEGKVEGRSHGNEDSRIRFAAETPATPTMGRNIAPMRGQSERNASSEKPSCAPARNTRVNATQGNISTANKAPNRCQLVRLNA